MVIVEPILKAARTTSLMVHGIDPIPGTRGIQMTGITLVVEMKINLWVLRLHLLSQLKNLSVNRHLMPINLGMKDSVMVDILVVVRLLRHHLPILLPLQDPTGRKYLEMAVDNLLHADQMQGLCQIPKGGTVLSGRVGMKKRHYEMTPVMNHQQVPFEVPTHRLEGERRATDIKIPTVVGGRTILGMIGSNGTSLRKSSRPGIMVQVNPERKGTDLPREDALQEPLNLGCQVELPRKLLQWALLLLRSSKEEVTSLKI